MRVTSTREREGYFPLEIDRAARDDLCGRHEKEAKEKSSCRNRSFEIQDIRTGNSGLRFWLICFRDANAREESDVEDASTALSRDVSVNARHEFRHRQPV